MQTLRHVLCYRRKTSYSHMSLMTGANLSLSDMPYIRAAKTFMDAFPTAAIVIFQRLTSVY